ncbi:MAG TPA: ATP synthase F1 subunit epsilon [Bacteroidales bacterium]|nr:ATP synthase F1 subunit epsilon [Bacteroidales bacterium]
MKIVIITPDNKVYSGEIRSVRVPGASGSFQVLQDHAPIISTLVRGPVFISDDQAREIKYEISGGVIEVKKNKVILLADSIITG